MGMSMGCMHAFLFADRYPDFLNATMPLACSVLEIARRNRIFRKVRMDAIRNDPGYQQEKYKQQPAASKTAIGMSPALEGCRCSIQLARRQMRQIADMDANDVLYAFDASRDYDASAKLDQIKAAVMWVNTADDIVNPPEPGIAEEHDHRLQ
jgi:homoserine O-acetyltransferase